MRGGGGDGWGRAIEEGRQREEKIGQANQESPWLNCQGYAAKRAGGREVKPLDWGWGGLEWGRGVPSG